MRRVGVAWRERGAPLEPIAALACGAAVRRLLTRLLEDTDDALRRLRGVGAPNAVCILGSSLPWVDGLVFLGRDARAPSLLLPTTLEPDVPPALVERALLTRLRDASPPLAIAPDERVVVPCGHALALGRAELAALLGELA